MQSGGIVLCVGRPLCFAAQTGPRTARQTVAGPARHPGSGVSLLLLLGKHAHAHARARISLSVIIFYSVWQLYKSARIQCKVLLYQSSQQSSNYNLYATGRQGRVLYTSRFSFVLSILLNVFLIINNNCQSVYVCQLLLMEWIRDHCWFSEQQTINLYY